MNPVVSIGLSLGSGPTIIGPAAKRICRTSSNLPSVSVFRGTEAYDVRWYTWILWRLPSVTKSLPESSSLTDMGAQKNFSMCAD